MLLLSFPVRVPSSAIEPVPPWILTGSKNGRLLGILILPLLSDRPIAIELNPFWIWLISDAVKSKALVLLSVPPTTIFCPAVEGCRIRVLLPETCPEKSISPAVKFSGLSPADNVEPKAIVASPRAKFTGAFSVTGPLKLMLSLVVVIFPLKATVPAPFWINAPSKFRLLAILRLPLLVIVNFPSLVVFTIPCRLMSPPEIPMSPVTSTVELKVILSPVTIEFLAIVTASM